MILRWRSKDFFSHPSPFVSKIIQIKIILCFLDLTVTCQWNVQIQFNFGASCIHSMDNLEWNQKDICDLWSEGSKMRGRKKLIFRSSYYFMSKMSEKFTNQLSEIPRLKFFYLRLRNESSHFFDKKPGLWLADPAGQPIRGLVFGREMAGIHFSISDKRWLQL